MTPHPRIPELDAQQRLALRRPIVMQLVTARQRARRMTRLRRIGALLLAAAVAGFWAPSPTIGHDLARSLVLWALLGLALALIATSYVRKNEVARLEDRLQRIDQEATDLERARDVVGSADGFALFLRSFDAELRGLSQSGVHQGSMIRARRAVFQSRYGDMPIDDDYSHLAAGARWKTQLALLAALRKRLPVLLLANARLDSTMSDELTRLGIKTLTIEQTDWWQIVTGLAARAALVVFLIEQATPMLLREMQHVLTERRRYIVIVDKTEMSRLRTLWPQAGEFLRSAATVFTFDRATEDNIAQVAATEFEAMLDVAGILQPGSTSGSR